MVEIFTDLHATYKNIPSRMKAESFKQRVVSCFKAWEVCRHKVLNPGFVYKKIKIPFTLGLGTLSTSVPDSAAEHFLGFGIKRHPRA